MAYYYDNVKLDKGMYREAGRSFTQVLEREDPSERYKGTSLEGLDAFQRQLKRFNIKVKGDDSGVVDEFFQTSQASVLFPEFISRTVRQGMEESDILPQITAAVTTIDGLNYHSITSEVSDKEETPDTLEEGDAIPATTVKIQDNKVKLKKRGRMLVASYEAIRFQKLDLFSVTLRQIGAHIARANLKDAVEVLMNDGSYSDGTPIKTETMPLNDSDFNYGKLVEFWSKFDPYVMNTLLVSNGMMLKLLQLSELQNPLTGLNFQGTGKLTTPLGANLLRTGVLEKNTAVGLDKRFALEMVQSGGVMVEYDKLIDRQLERAAITTITGFAKVFPEASRVLKLQ